MCFGHISRHLNRAWSVMSIFGKRFESERENLSDCSLHTLRTTTDTSETKDRCILSVHIHVDIDIGFTSRQSLR